MTRSATVQQKTKYRFISTRASQRIQALYTAWQNAVPTIDIERAKLITESLKRTEGEPLPIRWAKALRHVGQQIAVHIDDQQLIVGTIGTGRYSLLYPEANGDQLPQFVKAYGQSRKGTPRLTRDDEETVLTEVYPYWKDHVQVRSFLQRLPDDVQRAAFEDTHTYASRHIISSDEVWRTSSGWVPNYEKALTVGFQKIKEEALEKIESLSLLQNKQAAKEIVFWRATAIAAEGIIQFSQRYSQAALSKSFSETDPIRKKELVEIAKICAKVPTYPANSFHEALQAQWFIQLFSWLEQRTTHVISSGRLDQYTYPYYAADLAAGKLTQERAKELLFCSWFQKAGYTPLTGNLRDIPVYTPQEGDCITIGGVQRNGADAVNGLTYVILAARREFPLPYPDIAARIDRQASTRYLHEIALTIRQSSVVPQLVNDDAVIAAVIEKGGNRESARDYAIAGNVEVHLPDTDSYPLAGSQINLGAALELTLYNGRIPRYGDGLLTIETGDPETFTTWKEFETAFLRQERYLIDLVLKQQEYIELFHTQQYATPFISALHDVSRQYAVDLQQQTVTDGLRAGYFDLVGYGTAADGLVAIKRNVYDKQTISIHTLKQGLLENFKGYEDLQQTLLISPTYGNDEGEVDSIAKKIDLVAVKAANAYYERTGTYIDAGYHAGFYHLLFGAYTGALPNGRNAGEPLSEGVSPSLGADVTGPTAVLISNYRSNNVEIHHYSAQTLTLSLNAETLAHEDGIDRLTSFIKSWCALGLWNIQFNIVHKEQLQNIVSFSEDNDNSIIVRVASELLFFEDTQPIAREDIENRTIHDVL